MDILTGEVVVLRADIVYDNGQLALRFISSLRLTITLQALDLTLTDYCAGFSLNPLVDIGQIEGAFVMGLGFHFTGQLASLQLVTCG